MKFEYSSKDYKGLENEIIKYDKYIATLPTISHVEGIIVEEKYFQKGEHMELTRSDGYVGYVGYAEVTSEKKGDSYTKDASVIQPGIYDFVFNNDVELNYIKRFIKKDRSYSLDIFPKDKCTDTGSRGNATDYTCSFKAGDVLGKVELQEGAKLKIDTKVFGWDTLLFTISPSEEGVKMTSKKISYYQNGSVRTEKVENSYSCFIDEQKNECKELRFYSELSSLSVIFFDYTTITIFSSLKLVVYKMLIKKWRN
ncbi:MAG: hypothetical protein ACRC0V_01330 [Fusobacteriaceae bacterium]